MKAFRPKRTTRAKLAAALATAGAPAEMIQKAIDGAYDDYLSASPSPIADLINDCRAHRLYALAAQAAAGVFDGQRWEAEAWAKSPDGRAVFAELRRGMRLPRGER